MTSISFWAQIYFFLAVIHLFVIAYLSKSLNLSEKSSKMIKIQYTNPKPVSPHPGPVRPSVDALDVILHDYNVAMVYWLDRIFEISNHILENAFSQYKVSKIMLKLLLNCL